ncbi:MAG: glycerophosphodiester phosphodiesterase family protein [Propionibacteriaceae bacterium]|nr:glycerophosphodiester phosphodiesterase family protein [Propionibacteriaceae bacterium]
MARTVGLARYAETNRMLASLLERRGPLVVVHRGSAKGSVAENTVKAVRAALAQGGDIMELDVVASTDGEFFLFHDGYEPLHFGVGQRLTELAAAEIEALNYRWCDARPGAYPVERLAAVLDGFPDEVFALDRSWRWWPSLLDVLAARQTPGRFLLKSFMDETSLRHLAEYPVKFPFLPIVSTPEHVERVLGDPELNTVVLELIADSPEHTFCDDGYLRELRSRNVLLLGNALTLASGPPLYAGHDDDISITVGPEAGWGVLMDKGFDLIQTDWPALVSAHLRDRGLRQNWTGAP